MKTKLCRHEFEIGEKVKTDFSGEWTYHRIIDKHFAQSESGILVKVKPPVPKSSGGGIDSNWFYSA